MDSFLTVQETARILKISPRTVRRAIKDGRIKGFKVGTGKRSIYRINEIEIQRMQSFDLKEFMENAKTID